VGNRGVYSLEPQGKRGCLELKNWGLSGWTELGGRAYAVSWDLCNGNKEEKAWDLL
jgi:hypothetical protein